MSRMLLMTISLILASCQNVSESNHLAEDELSNPIAQDLSCKSFTEIDGWDGSSTTDFVFYRAKVVSDVRISEAEIDGAYRSDSRDLVADLDPENRYPRHRFRTLEDAWCWFNLLVPKGFSEREGDFRGTIQFICEEWSGYSYIDMSCRIDR
jgi:hypothetical protein